MEWAAFERVEGPMLLGDRLDWIGAVLAYVTAASHGADITLRKIGKTFFDWDRKEIPEDVAARALEMTLEAAASQRSPHSSSKS